MLKRERQALILREANIHNKVLQSDLSELLKVSEDTIRRDLQDLAEADLLVKVRGGAISKSFHTQAYEGHQVYAYAEKTEIARKAVPLIREGMHVLISGGTTNLELARILPPDLKATFFTMSLPMAIQLSRHPSSETLFIGGRISGDAQISTGGEAMRKILSLRPDLCIMGANSIDLKAGLTESDWEVVEIKQAMAEVAVKVVALAISEKLGTVQKLKICPLSALDYLITERSAEDAFLDGYQQSGPQLL